MAKIERYVRTSGATTVKKDGKIIGNIGRGKDKVPTVQRITTVNAENKQNKRLRL